MYVCDCDSRGLMGMVSGGGFDERTSGAHVVMLGSVELYNVCFGASVGVRTREHFAAERRPLAAVPLRILREDCISMSGTFIGHVYAFADYKRKKYAKLMFFWFSYAPSAVQNQEAVLTSCA